jgi:DNA invertase Pin-like site-specific DNA recombinase
LSIELSIDNENIRSNYPNTHYHNQSTMKIGYARVSTPGQCLNGQIDRLNDVNCDRIFSDIASGGKASRPELDAMLGLLREGDLLIITKLDRLGRSLRHLLNLIHELNERGIGVRVIDQGIDTTTAAGRMLMHFIGAIAEFERQLNHERTISGLIAARARGKVGGRKPKLSKAKISQLRQMADNPANSIADICATFNVSKSSFYRYRGDNKPDVKTSHPESTT